MTGTGLKSVGGEGATIPTTSSEGINYPLSQNVFSPGGVDYGFTQATPENVLTSEPETSPGLTAQQQKELQSVLGTGLNALLSNKATGSGTLGTSATGSGITTGESAGTSGGSPGGTELDPSTGKAPQLVWGDQYSSLKEGLNL
jgi:hypothetical protein